MRKDFHPDDAAVRHLVAHLPDSLKQRRAVLKLLLRAIADDYPHSDWLRTQLAECEQTERSQKKFLELLDGGTEL